MSIPERDRLTDCQGLVRTVIYQDEWTRWKESLNTDFLNKKKPIIFRCPKSLNISSYQFGTWIKTGEGIYANTMIEELRKEMEENMALKPGKQYQIGYDYNPLRNDQMLIHDYLQKAYGVKQLIFNPPATIVFWLDGTKTVVKCVKGEKFNPYHGFCAAVCKKLYTSNSSLNRGIQKAWEESKEKMSKEVLEDIEKSAKTVKKQRSNVKNG